MVEAAAGARDDEDAPPPECERLVERQLEIGRVLPGRVRDDAGPGRAGGGECFGRDRVEIADHDVDLEPERERAIETAVGGDDGRCRGHRDDGARPRGDDHDIRLDHAFLRWHYPGQVLRVGGASAALSARSPELPGSLGES